MSLSSIRELSRNGRRRCGRCIIYTALACFALHPALLSLTSCTGYDLAEEDPSWLGSSIYDYLNSNGNFTNTVRLIEDLGYADVLAKTGSKTLFVADDDAFARFFQKNDWGVSSYSQLSLSQKKLLLYGSMINNACQVAYLSSSQGPVEGDCMRRLTATSAYDSVPILTPADMPETEYWDYYRTSDKTIPCMEDITTPPMIHFIEAFLENREISNDDCRFLQNGVERAPGDANVNGIIMEEQNIKCSNGFIHKMAEVITPLPNMAQVINQKPELSSYANLLERYCAPYYNETATTEYNRIYGTAYDSVFQKRYFSERSQGGTSLELTPMEGPVNGTLKFDPGWNEFYSQTSSASSTNVALQENMGVMLVPSNEAFSEYWNNGAGKVLKDYYGSWDNVPDKVVSKMINVNMLNSFTNSVPSKFKTVLNDANDEMGLDTAFVDHVYMACNGAVYVTNKVFNPVAYVSVSFPALVNESMNILYWGIEQLQYEVYLNSQNSYYSLFIPTNDALLEYVDPCSYGKTSTQLFRFHYKATAQTQQQKVWASIWNYDTETGAVTDSIGEATYDQIKDRLKDILDYHIVIGNVEDGNSFYQTKGGGMLYVQNASQGEGGMAVSGSMQYESETPVTVTKVYDESKEGNGKTYILNSAPLMSTRKAVSDVLKEHEEFSAFWNLLEASQYLESKHVIGTDEHGCASKNINLFNTFNYTIFVPTNEAIEKMQADGLLPTWEQVEMEEDTEIRDSLTNEIEMFLKYHIQDNSLYIGQGSVSGKYETAAYTIDDGNLSYHKLTTSATNNGISITDELGNTREVVKTPGLYNIMTREYQYDSSDAMKASSLYTSSYAVVHQIDGVLNYKKGGNQ